MFTPVYSCLITFTCVFIYLPLFTRVCLPMFTNVYSCLPMFTLLYQWLLVFIYVYICLLMFTPVYSCLPMFTRVYLCLPLLLIFTLVYSCLPMFNCIYICLLLLTLSFLHMWPIIRKGAYGAIREFWVMHMWPNIGKPALSQQISKLSYWHDMIEKINISNGDCLVSIRLSIGKIEAETRGTSNNKSCEKNAIIDYFKCFRSHPCHVKRPPLLQWGHITGIFLQLSTNWSYTTL